MDDKEVDEVLVIWDKKEDDVSQGIKSGVFVDGKRMPVAEINVEIGPHGNDYVIFKLHAFRVTFEVED